jgi:hypothetical protein
MDCKLRQSRPELEIASPFHFVETRDDIMVRDGCSRTEAMQKARQENAAEFSIFQLI